MFSDGERYFLGIDGGGKKTEFALADSDGNIIRTTILGTSNPSDIGIDAALNVIKTGISEVCADIPKSNISLFAGLAVLCYPNDVFVETIGINIQTMVHHGSQILLGVFLAVRYRKELNVKRFFSGFAVFVAMVLVAMILNISMYHILGAFNIDETFNMFYISPYFNCTLPLLSIVWEYVPYIVFVMIYFFGFILCALIVYGLEKALIKGGKSYIRYCKIKSKLQVKIYLTNVM